MDVWYVRGYALGDRGSMHDDDVFERECCLLFVLAETKIRSQTSYTFRNVRTIRGCLEGLALMI